MSINAPIFDNFTTGIRPRTAWNNDGPRGMVNVKQLTITEADGTAAGAHTVKHFLPERSILVDIIVYAEAVWNDGVSASLVVGDYDTAGVEIDLDGYFTAVNLLTGTDLDAQQTVRLSGNLTTAGGTIGAYGNVGTNTHLTDLYYADGCEIRAVVAAGDGLGTTGITHIFILWATDANPHYSTFVAT